MPFLISLNASPPKGLNGETQFGDHLSVVCRAVVKASRAFSRRSPEDAWHHRHSLAE
jgi:hypothetical protein